MRADLVLNCREPDTLQENVLETHDLHPTTILILDYFTTPNSTNEIKIHLIISTQIYE